MDESTLAQAAADTPSPNMLVRIAQVFVSPAVLFDSLKRHPVWIDVMLLLMVSAVAAQLLIPEETLRSLMEAQVPAGSDPEQLDRIVGFTRAWGAPLAAVSTPVSIAVVAGILILAYNVMLGGEATFRQLFSATTHAFLILTAGGFLALGLVLMGGDQVVISPAALLPDLGDGYLARFAYRTNVFAIWNSIVLGIAVSRIYPKRSAGGAAAYLLVLYTLVVALSAIRA